jgi:hypothetical protein
MEHGARSTEYLANRKDKKSPLGDLGVKHGERRGEKGERELMINFAE